jgi:hypothetical protein
MMRSRYVSFFARSALISAALVAACTFASCARIGGLSSVKFPATPVISSVDSVVLVLDPYISIRDQPGESGITVAHGRRGEIFNVTGKRIIRTEETENLWIQLENGWVPETAVRLYAGKEKALQDAALLK